MSGEIHKGPLEAAPVDPARRRSSASARSWREKRWERRKQRRRVEEALGWVLVPIILVGCYWALKAGLNAIGTSPTAILQALRITSGS